MCQLAACAVHSLTFYLLACEFILRLPKQVHAICHLPSTVKSLLNISHMRKQLLFALTNDAVTSTLYRFSENRTSAFLFPTKL